MQESLFRKCLVLMENQATKTRKTESIFDRMLLPITFAVIGIGAMTIAAILAARAEERRIAEEGGYEVENYDIVKNKPYINSL